MYTLGSKRQVFIYIYKLYVRAFIMSDGVGQAWPRCDNTNAHSQLHARLRLVQANININM